MTGTLESAVSLPSPSGVTNVVTSVVKIQK
jgi:hypothetical protein